MIKLRTNFGIAILLILSSCNTFRQKVTVGPGTGEFRDHTLEILLMLGGAFTLGLWLGWILWNKYKSMVEGLRIENNSLTTSVNNYRSELEALKLKLSTTENEKNELHGMFNKLSWENNDYKTKLISVEDDLTKWMEQNKALETEIGLLHASTPESAAIPMEVVTSPVDLHIEDLGVAVEEEIVNMEDEIVEHETIEVEADLFAETGESTIVEEIVEKVDIIEDVRPIDEDLPESPAANYIKKYVSLEEVNIPITSEKIIELPVETIVETETLDLLGEPEFELIEEFETVSEIAPISEPEVIEVIPSVEHVETLVESVKATTFVKTPVVAAFTAHDHLDDFKIVEGIGPKIEELLHRNGIATYTQLAATPVSRIKEILQSAGSNYSLHDPSTWPAQSLLAANSEWDNLKSYQLFLNAGRRP